MIKSTTKKGLQTLLAAGVALPLLLTGYGSAHASVPSATKIIDVYPGNTHVLALDSKHNLFGWGSNSEGEINSSSDAIVRRAKFITGDVISAAAGKQVSAYATTSGHVFMRGGDGAAGESQVMDDTGLQPLSGVVQVFAGNTTFAALTQSGDVYTWSSDLPHAQKNAPADAVTKFKDVVIGQTFIAALSTSGTVFMIGDVLGSSLPSSPFVPFNLSNVESITGGGQDLFALKKDGTVWGVGDNDYGQLGDGTKIDRSVPVQAKNAKNIVEVSSSGSHVVAKAKNSHLWYWGKNNQSQLGDPDLVADLPTPTSSDMELSSFDKYTGYHAYAGHDYTLLNLPTSMITGYGAYDKGQTGEPLDDETSMMVVLDSATLDPLGYDAYANDMEAATSLGSLSVTGYTISPKFDPEEYFYTLKVPNTVSSISLKASTLPAGSHLEINGVTKANNETVTIPLQVGENEIVIDAIIPNGLYFNDYYLTVTREAPVTWITFPSKTPLYHSNSLKSGIAGYLKPSGLKTIEKKGDFYLVNTYLGKKWIHSSYVQQPFQQGIRTVRTLELYDAPNAKMKKPAMVKPSTLTTYAKMGNWYLVKTWLGQKWIYHTDTVKPVSLPLVLKSKTVLKDEVAGKNTAYSLPAGTIVNAYEQSGNYYHISTKYGKHWIQLTTPITPINEKIKMTKTFQLYSTPSSTAGTGKYAKPVTLTAFEKTGNWYHVKTWMGDKWVLKQ